MKQYLSGLVLFATAIYLSISLIYPTDVEFSPLKKAIQSTQMPSTMAVTKAANKEIENCQLQFNEEFNIQFEYNYRPVPMSIFHRNNSLIIVMSIGKDQAKVKRVKHPPISVFAGWFLTKSWRINFLDKLDEMMEANCTNLNPPSGMTEILLLQCPVNQSRTGSQFRISISGTMSKGTESVSIFYNNLLSCERPFVKQRDRIFLAICLLIGDDHINRLPEFIIYHHLVGVEKFYIYYNFKGDVLRQKWQYFQRFVEAGLIELFPYYFKTRNYLQGIQYTAYHECLFKARGEVKWLGFLDVDEFFQLEPYSSFQSLTDLLKANDKFSSVSFQTHFYAFEGNASNFEKSSKTFPSYINEWLLRKDENQRRWPKSIHQTDLVTTFDPHVAIIKKQPSTTISQHHAVLAHYRFPYFDYTIQGIKDGTYRKNETFKKTYGGKVLEKLVEFGYQSYHTDSH